MQDIQNLDDLTHWLDGGAQTPAMINGIDITPLLPRLRVSNLKRATFAGVDPEVSSILMAQGATLIPELDVIGFSNCPNELYDVAWLYNGLDLKDDASWQMTRDHRGFVFYNDKPNVTRFLNPVEAIATRLHDSFMERALIRHMATLDLPVVAFMGGHGIERDDPTYETIVRLSRQLRQNGFIILTGGGPGIMEAANLGAFLASYEEPDVVASLKLLSPVKYDTFEWLRSAAMVRQRLLGRWDAPSQPCGYSISIPTWHYGHEPPNMFASHIAKLFNNSLREEGLITFANSGIIFCKGAAGTVQEAFQDLTQNYYRNGFDPTPMIFFDADFWTHERPIMPLVMSMAKEKTFDELVLSTSDPKAVSTFLYENRPHADTMRRRAHQRLNGCLSL